MVEIDLPQQFLKENPRITSTVLGEKIILGETIFPDRDKYPGWSLTLFSFPENSKKDGCLISVAPNTATPIGLVGEPPEQIEVIKPSFTEWLIQGSGILLIETPDRNIQKIEVSAEKPIIYKYGKGTKVAYIAGPDGLEGVNIGNPNGISEDSLDDNDSRASLKFWKEYHKLIVK